MVLSEVDALSDLMSILLMHAFVYFLSVHFFLLQFV
jgi:hypothetical protein